MSATWALSPGWLLQSALGGGLLLLLAWGVMTRAGQPARRHFLGALGVSAALLAALLCLGPRWFVLPVPASVWQGSATTPLVAEVAYLDDGPPLEAELLVEESLTDPAPVTPVAETTDGKLAFLAAALPRWLAIGWAVGAMLLLGRWVLGYVALARLLRAAHVAPADVTRLFNRMAVDVRPTPRLLVSRQVCVPFSCGLLRPTVVLPPDLCDADAARLRWVFAHELTHLERRDAWTACLFGLAQAIYFYVPWFWWLRRQVRLCQEYLADAAAARQAGSAEDYAQFLLSLTTKPAVPLGATGVTGNTSDLFRRVSMLLHASNAVEKRCGWLWSLAATAGLFALAIFVSGIGLRAEAAPEDDKKPATQDIEIKLVVSPDQSGEKKVIVISSDGKVIRELIADGSDKDKKKTAQAGELPKVAFPDVEEIIKKLPAGMSKEQVEQFRVQMMKAREDMQRAMDKIKQQMPKIEVEYLDSTKKLREALIKVEKDDVKVREKLVELRKALGEHQKAVDGQKPNVRFWATPDVQGRLTTALKATEQGRLGIRVEKLSDALTEQLDLPKGQGLVILEVVADSAAAKAGLKSNDILLLLDGKTIPNDADVLASIVSGLKAGTPVDAIVMRKGKKETVKGINVGAGRVRSANPLQGAPGTVQPKIEIKPGDPVIRNRIQVQPVPGANVPARVRVVSPDDKSVTMIVNRNNDNFTATYQEGGVTVNVAGTVEGGKAKASSIEVKEGNKTSKFDSVDKVPAEQRDRVKKLLDALTQGGGQIKIKAPATPAIVPPLPAVPAKPAVPAVPKRPVGRDILFYAPTPGMEPLGAEAQNPNAFFRGIYAPAK